MSGLYLVDAMALAYRSFYALLRTDMRSPGGLPTTAIYGFAQALIRVAESREVSHMAIVRDLPGPTFRHKMYPEYKAQRQPMPDALKEQIPWVERLADACGLPVLSKPEFEADDLMATYAKVASAAGIPVYLMTRDKDLMALVTDSVKLFDPGRGGERPEEIDPEWVKGKFGVAPSQVRDYLALVGDASDNVPGVPRVGEKTAADLLSQYPDIEAIYSNLDAIGQKKKALRANLEAGRESMELSRTLVTLRDDVEISVSLEELEYKGLDIAKLRQFLTELGMKTLLPALSRLGQKAGAAVSESVHPDTEGLGLFDAPSAEAKPQSIWKDDVAECPVSKVAGNYQVASSREDLEMLRQILSHVPVAALDLRAVVPGTVVDRPVGFSISWGDGIGRYVPLSHATLGNAAIEDVHELLAPLLADANRSWIAADARNALRALSRENLPVAGRVDDVSLAAYILAPGERQSAIDKIAARRAGHTMVAPESVTGTGRNRKTFEQADPDSVAAYSAEGADWAFRLWPVLKADLEREGLWDLYDGLERPLGDVLSAMEDDGVALDRDLFRKLSKEMKVHLVELEAKAHQMAGEPFNVASPKQLGEILFQKLGLKSGRKTSTGQISTDSDTLEDLKELHPLPGVILEHRESAKLLGTYVDVLPGLCDANNRVHTRFNQTVAATGRLSSTDPNLQNIPIRGELGRRIREGFVASTGNVLIAADYSQIELRLLAHLCEDEALREVYRLGQDIHARTAALVAGVDPSQVTSDMRRQAKVVNFGVVYGMGAHALSQQLGVPFAEAKRFIDGYFAAYPAVKPWMEKVVEEGREKGYVTTLLGRKRWIKELGDKNRAVRERAEREAANTPVQGSAADLVKKAMLVVDHEIREKGLPARMLLQVHDELVFEAAAERAEEAASRIRAIMESAMTLSVPLVAEAGVARSWGGAH